jgi:hypothetical protein
MGSPAEGGILSGDAPRDLPFGPCRNAQPPLRRRWRHFRRRQPRAAPWASAREPAVDRLDAERSTDRARNGTPSMLDFFVLSGKVLAPFHPRHGEWFLLIF